MSKSTEAVNLQAELHTLSHKSTTCVMHTEPQFGYMCYAESVTRIRMADERAIAALLLSPPSVIALRPIRIETRARGYPDLASP